MFQDRIQDFKQVQKSGNSSLNIQAENVVINSGISEEQARQIALEVFCQNVYHLSGTGRTTFEARAEQFRNQYFQSQLQNRAEGLLAFTDPDFLYVIASAQRDFARSGRTDLEQVLIDLLVQRSSSTDLAKIVLNEAIIVAPTLTERQLDALSLILLFVHAAPITYDFNTLDDFGLYLKQYIVPLLSDALQDSSTYLHLKYTGCATLDLGGASFIYHIESAFPGCFAVGFERDEVEALLAPISDLFIPCYRDQRFLQFRPMDCRSFSSICRSRGLSDIDGLLLMQGNRLMDVEQARTLLCDIDSQFAVFSAPGSSGMSPLEDIQLTTVGIALGNANLRRKWSRAFDLSEWIR